MSPRKAAPYEPKTLTAKRLCEYFEGRNFVEISKQTTITDRQIAGYLKGENPPGVKLLEYIAENGGDVNYILTGEKAPEHAGADGVTDSQKSVVVHVQTLVGLLLDIQKLALEKPSFAANVVAHFENIQEALEKIQRA